MTKFHSIEKEIVEVIQEWKTLTVTFSGGKDSTALTFALLNAVKNCKNKPHKIWILYANTLVEPSPLLQTAKSSLNIFKDLGKKIGIPILPQILIPQLKDRFWVLLIGKGYPPPSIRFRWCSERLKIRPVRNFLKEVKEKYGEYPLVLTGVRLDEGNNRKKNLLRRLTNDKWMKYEGLKECSVYAPLLSLTTDEVWEYIKYNEKKWGINMQYLKKLYSEEFGSMNGFRTGCWVCTLVKRDQSLEKLAEREPELVPLIEFRKFLLEIRDNKKLRNKVRKNGKSYLGPLNKKTRRKILKKLEGIYKLPSEEKKLIYEMWRKS